VVVSHVGDKLASAMEERFGIPPVWAPWPLGAAGSRSWYRLLEARTGARFPGVDRAYDEVRKREEEVGRKVAGVRFALAHLHIGEPFALARYLEDRGMVPHSILCSSVRDEERDDAEVLVERGHDPYVVPPERWSLRRLYADDPPDLFVGFGALARELSVANVPLVDGGLPGFEGTRLFLDYLEAYGAKGTLESGGVRG